MSFLYPVERYVNALRQSQLCPDRPDLSIDGCHGETVPNPIFQDLSGTGAAVRDEAPPPPIRA